ncbi:HlyD family secretion protein [cyanobacterium TDX16]|nr:HlyD family secretion protein [cyanobacterium TDX16]
MTNDILKPSNRWLTGLILTATAIAGATGFYVVSQSSQPSPPVATTPPVTQVTALGRLEPETEAIRLFAPSALDGDRVDQLLVKEGDRVKAGQTIAILDSRDRLQNALAQAREQVRVAQAKLAQVRAGAKTGEIKAQEATIARIQAEIAGETSTQNATIARYQAEVSNALAEYNRFLQLYRQGAISASNIDSRRLTLETAQAQLKEALSGKNRTVETLQAQLQEAKATLNQIAEVRPVDVNAAQTEVDTAIAAAKTAETQLQEAYIRAPISGQILKIRTREGEKISDSGIVEMGQTAQMVAVAEVYQTDIGKVKLGQPAIITSQAISEQLRGQVSQIGLQVDRQNVFSNQPGENLDRRIVEVKIRLTPEASQQVAGLTNLQVETAIQL